jgi:hypothetical protein
VRARSAFADVRIGLVLAGAWLLLTAASPELPAYDIAYDKTISIEFPGATAAYSLDPYVAEASAVAGVVRIHGTGKGTTVIVVVAGSGTTSIKVSVAAPPIQYPAGFYLERPGAAGESGFYEFRYASNPAQLTNALDLRRQEGDAFERLQIVNADVLSKNAVYGNVASFPFVSYEAGNAQRDLILLDESVVNSPLTVDDQIVRGLHFKTGSWLFHGGVSSVAAFQNNFFATNPEYVAGITRRFELAPHRVMSANLYDFLNPPAEVPGPSGGIVGSLSYSYEPTRDSGYFTEIGYSHGLGGAARWYHADARETFVADARYEPPAFASLGLDNRRGLFGDSRFSRTLNERWDASASAYEADYETRTFREKSFSTTAYLTDRLNRHLWLEGGAAYASFATQVPQPFSLQTLTGSLGIQYASQQFGAGVQYLPTTNFTGRVAGGYAANASDSFGDAHLGGFYRHDAQIPTVETFLSEVPGLQDALNRSGIFISDADQLAQLLGDPTFLASIGLPANLQLDLAPSRDELGFDAGWMSRRAQRQRWSLSALDSRTRLVSGTFRFQTAFLDYAQDLSPTDAISGSFSVFKTMQRPAGRATTAFGLTLHHKFSGMPSLLLPSRHGNISGHVFLDEGSSGRFADGSHGIPGVEVLLDDVRSTSTDQNGYYAFSHLPFGRHRVEAKAPSSKPYFLTTDSPVTAEINSTIDFGVSLVKGRLFGYVRSDAGDGIAGVSVEIEGPSGSRRLSTAADGKFSVVGIPDGDYTLATSPDSYPAGYDLTHLSPISVAVAADAPSPASIVVRALRSVEGTVRCYDPKTLKSVPARDVEVSIAELSLKMTTDSQGHFLFRDLPAGRLTIRVRRDGLTTARTFDLPAAPTIMTSQDFTLKL